MHEKYSKNKNIIVKKYCLFSKRNCNKRKGKKERKKRKMKKIIFFIFFVALSIAKVYGPNNVDVSGGVSIYQNNTKTLILLSGNYLKFDDTAGMYRSASDLSTHRLELLELYKDQNQNDLRGVTEGVDEAVDDIFKTGVNDVTITNKF
jgi:hypothetical protein